MKTVSILALGFLASPLATFASTTPTSDPVVAPLLGRCSRFALHGHAGVAASGDKTDVYGDVGGDDAISGFGPAPLPHVHDETLYGYYSAATTEATSCKADKEIAYRAARAATCTTADTAVDLAGLTLTPGVYCNAAGKFEITTGALTLDGGGDSDAVFIFQAATTVATSINTDIVLTNGAQAKNIFWATGAGIKLAGYSTFRGNLLAYSSITMGTGTVLSGRALAGTESVTLAGLNNISKPELIVNGGSDI